MRMSTLLRNPRATDTPTAAAPAEFLQRLTPRLATCALLYRLIPLGLAIFLIGASGDRPTLIEAAKNSDRDMLRMLLRQRVDVNAAAGDGSPALHWASYRQRTRKAAHAARAARLLSCGRLRSGILTS